MVPVCVRRRRSRSYGPSPTPATGMPPGGTRLAGRREVGLHLAGGPADASLDPVIVLASLHKYPSPACAENVRFCRCDTRSHLASELADWRADYVGSVVP